MSIQSINPATGEVLENFQETSMSEIDEILEAAETTFHEWRHRPFAERTQKMRQAAALLRAGKEKYARTMSLEMGKPIVQGEAEAEKCAWTCDYYAEHAEAFLADQLRETEASRSYIRFEPLGPVLAIMPWNFPFWQVFRFAAPALMAGNAGILKHASNVPRCALHIEDIFREAGFPKDLFRTVLAGPEKVSAVIADPRIRAATLTGSEGAGSKVAAQAGREIKKTVLELGGSDPFIVLEDADVQKAAKMAADARLINSGQSCIAAKRFIVVEKVAGAFLETFVSEMRSRKMGDPLDRQTQVGPQARDYLRASLHRQVGGVGEAGRQATAGRPDTGRPRRFLSAYGAGQREQGDAGLR
jgi:succinate-semialdehyde dehydrogenase/glutarate-semialdehyde dehydrogenase